MRTLKQIHNQIHNIHIHIYYKNLSTSTHAGCSHYTKYLQDTL